MEFSLGLVLRPLVLTLLLSIEIPEVFAGEKAENEYIQLSKTTALGTMCTKLKLYYDINTASYSSRTYYSPHCAFCACFIRSSLSAVSPSMHVRPFAGICPLILHADATVEFDAYNVNQNAI